MTITKGFVVLTDHFYGVGYEVREYALDFKVFSVCQTFGTDDAEPPRFELIDCGNTFPIESWQTAEWEISGHIKWDGCINWQTNDACMAHACGPRMVDGLQQIFATAYHIAKRHFDLLGDAVPNLPETAIELEIPQ